MVTREEMALILRRIAQLLELQGENPFKVRAYSQGADAVEGYCGDIVDQAFRGELQGIPGIGEALSKKLHELAVTGRLEFWEKLRAPYPDTIFELFELQGLGAKKIKALHQALGVDSVERLKQVCESGEAATLSGFGEKSVGKILQAIGLRESHAGRFLLLEALSVADEILGALQAEPACGRAALAGSARRGKETVHDLDFVVASRDPIAMMECFVHQPSVAEVVARGETKASVRLRNGQLCDLRVVTNNEFPFALNYFTGSKEHNVALRGRALKRGLTLNEYRIAPVDPEGASLPPIHTEEDLYRALELDFVEPELRENMGEIEAAELGEMPRLVELMNLRGTFHTHTTASDGRNTLREMALAAQELGLSYLGIADHSKSSVQANGLNEERLREQMEEIASLNAEFGPDFRLFSGTEVDILRNGSLDFPDSMLAELDYVVASVHSVFQLSEKEMTERILSAVASPHVTMLGHLTGRLLLQREPYPVNIPAVIEACAANGTWIELNGHPQRLDLDWRWWKLAKEKGVRCVITPDAHRSGDLQYLHFGVIAARKGWLTSGDVVNCLPVGEVKKALNEKHRKLLGA